MSRYILDIEADGLLRDVRRIWLVMLKDIDTGKKLYWKHGDLGWREALDQAALLVGHNLYGYDFLTLQKLHGYKLPSHVKVHDTMIMSLVLNYNRFPGGQHSLGNWGELLGYPKMEFNDFSQYSDEMLEYGLNDLEVTHRVYNRLLSDLTKVAEKSPVIRTYLRVEHAVAKWCGLAELHGWPFDLKKAEALEKQLRDEMQEAYDKLSPLLGLKVVPVDREGGSVVPKKPRWTKAGCYDAFTAKWFDVDPWSGYEGEERIVEGEYCRVLFEPLSLDSNQDVKTFLFRNGWEPTEWNFKRDPVTGEMRKTSPKITEDSLEMMKGNGKLYCDFLVSKSRHGVLKSWIANTDEDGNLHGSCFTIGTPSMRARHSTIVNVPSADSKWGKEMRELFTCKPGWKLIGCDSAGNQARGLAHYLNNPEFTNILLNDDIHTYNAQKLTEVLKEMGIDHEVPRGIAKRILYAFLFGASGAKLWSYIFGTMDAKKGNKLKSGFTRAVPGFKDLLEKLENIYGSTKQYGDGYIPGIGGNRIYVDSFHKLLVYLLQAAEKATCGAAVMLTMERLEEAGIPYIPCIMMHDEEDFLVPEEYAEQAAAIGKQAFADGPKLFGVTIMDGDAKIGDNWYEVH